MRGKSWAENIDRQATIEEYARAYSSGAFELAQRIQDANSDDNLADGWAAIDFQALRDNIAARKATEA